MKQDPCPRSRCAARASVMAMLVAAGLGLVAGAGAQNLPLPSLDLEVAPASKQVTLQWTEAPLTAGRTVSNVTLSGGWDFANSSTVEIVGDYVLDCDYRMRVTKIPQDPGLNRQLLLFAQLFDNVDATGFPLRTDTVRIVTADSVHAFRSSFAPDLGITISDNVGDPDRPLGTCPVTLSGVNSTISPTAGYFATALNSVSALSQGLIVKVAGPVDLTGIPNPLPPSVPTTTFTVTAPGQRFNVMDAMRISFGEGAAAPGDTVKWSAHYAFTAGGRIQADLETFEGYHVWRSDLPDLESFTLLGEIQQCESKFDFVLLTGDLVATQKVQLVYDAANRRFTVTDRDVHDDFPYRYAVSAFDRGFLGNDSGATFEGPLTKSSKLYPAEQASRPGRGIYVVPNPYKRRSDFQERDAKVVFANLPTECSIRIFNEAAEHVITLLHGPGQAESTSPTSREWNLRTNAGSPVVPGIYLFFVQGTDRSGAAARSVEQTGKLIVVR